MNRGRGYLAALLVCAALVGCGDDEGAGGLGQPCLPNDVCDNGLVCVAGQCDDPAIHCGNGVCDPFENETLCPADCETDPACGDAQAEGNEVCDGVDLGGETCQTQGFAAGTLACAATCDSFDTSGCTGSACGNGQIDGTELCDGVDLGGQTCLTQGFAAGTLACATTCDAFDTSGCNAAVCGNDTVEAAELCDGIDLAGESCFTQGFAYGTLLCASNCQSLDTSGCYVSMCDAASTCNDCRLCAETNACQPQVLQCGGNPACGDHLVCIQACVPPMDPVCLAACDAAHPAGMADAYAYIQCTYCEECFESCNGATRCAPPTCGNGQIEPPEACDGADLGGETCQSLGMAGGPLACGANCQALDPGSCVGCGNGQIETPELCDGNDLGGETCATQGYGSGTLACSSDCQSLIVAGCAGAPCDNTGDCSLCQNCASSSCTAAMGACAANADCISIVSCAQSCSDAACVTACMAAHPAGASLYQAVIDCMICQQCPVDCNGPSYGCP